MKNISKIIKLSRPLYTKVILLSLLVLLMSALLQVQPFFIKMIVDNIEMQIKGGNGSLQTVSFLMGGLLVVNLLSQILNLIFEAL